MFFWWGKAVAGEKNEATKTRPSLAVRRLELTRRYDCRPVLMSRCIGDLFPTHGTTLMSVRTNSLSVAPLPASHASLMYFSTSTTTLRPPLVFLSSSNEVWRYAFSCGGG